MFELGVLSELMGHYTRIDHALADEYHAAEHN